jgi:hypothetical protein
MNPVRDRVPAKELSRGSSEDPRNEYDPGRLIRTCPNCGARLVESRCKLLCPRCHYYMSCSDYY